MSYWYLDKMHPDFIDQVKDFENLMTMSAENGGTSKGGLNRITGSKEDKLMRDSFCQWLKNNGFEVCIDKVGNIFGYYVFAPHLDYVLCGSHLDSQPNGGRFDGVYGVLAGAASLKKIKKVMDQDGIEAKCNLAVVCWTNEEGARFQPSLTGSSYYCGQISLNDALQCQDTENVTLKDVLDEMGYLGEDKFNQSVIHYIELHIEQGGLLEQNLKTIGIVEGTWAALKLKIKFLGEQNHTGSSPMATRKDALLAAAHAIIKVRHYADLYPEQLHTSVGKIENYPNSPNIVPEITTIYLEIRSTDEALILATEKRLMDDFDEICHSTSTQFDTLSRNYRPGIALDKNTQDELVAMSKLLGLSTMKLKTIAGHDAISLSKKMPSNLIFIPSKSGISHNEAEFSSLEDLTSGMQLLTYYLAQKVGLKNKAAE